VNIDKTTLERLIYFTHTQTHTRTLSEAYRRLHRQLSVDGEARLGRASAEITDNLDALFLQPPAVPQVDGESSAHEEQSCSGYKQTKLKLCLRVPKTIVNITII